MIGHRLGDFEIVRLIGRGGMGAVYEAVQVSLGRRVALKILAAAQALDPDAVARFEREGRAVARLRHPNIVSVHLVGEAGGVRFIAMDLVSDCSLADVIASLGERAPEEPRVPIVGGLGGPSHAIAAATIGARIAEALHAAHEQGIIHRDVKPSNVLVTSDGVPLLIDFGIARATGTAALTSTGDHVGTPLYASPEQFRGASVAIDQRTDVYSLGVTLYELLTLRTLVSASSTAELIRLLALVEPRPMRGGRFAVPKDLETVVLKAMEKDPARRYATARALAEDLRRFLDGVPVVARPVGPLTRVARRAARRPAAVAGIGLVLGLMVVGGVAAKMSRDLAATRRAADQATARTWVEDAGADLHFGNYAAAIRRLRQAIDLDPSSTDARLELALARIDGKMDLDQVRRDLEQLEREQPALSAPRMLLDRVAHPKARSSDRDREPRSFLELYLEARSERLDGRLESAIDFAERARAVAPKDLRCLLFLIRLYRDAGRTNDLYSCARVCAALAPERGWANFNLASAEYARGALEESVEHYAIAVAVDPEDARFRMQYAGALKAIVRLEDAEREAREAVAATQRVIAAGDAPELRLALADAWVTLGDCLRASRHATAARQAFDAALETAPNHAAALAGRARVRLADDGEGALADARRAIVCATQRNDELSAWVALGQVLRAADDDVGAVAAYERALALDPAYDFAVRDLVAVLEKQGRSNEAVNVRLFAAADTRATALLLCWVAQWFLKTNRPDDAIRCARRAVEQRPRWADAHLYLGRSHGAVAAQRRGNAALSELELAAESLERACALDSKNAAPRCFRAEALYQLGRFAHAAAMYREAADLKPDVPILRVNAAYALELSGRRDDALRELGAILTEHPDLALARIDVGFIQLLSGDVDSARREFEGAARLDPNDPEPLVYLAMTDEARGDVASATARLAEAYRAGFRAPDPATLDGRLYDARWLAKLRRILSAHGGESVEAIEDKALLLASAIAGEPADLDAAVQAAETAVTRTERRDPAALRCLALVYWSAGRANDVARVCAEARQLPSVPDALRAELNAIFVASR